MVFYLIRRNNQFNGQLIGRILAIRVVQEGLSVASETGRIFHIGQATPKSTATKAILNYIYTNPSQNGDGSHLDAMPLYDIPHW